VKKAFKKWEVYVVAYDMNTGSEVNGQRPSIVFKDAKHTHGEDIVVIPLTSAVATKQADAFDVLVQKDTENNLYQTSRARIRQIRSVSIKRIGKHVGTITDANTVHAINQKVKEMLGTDE
jgi:mRNA-degrading endonuclease toxin of MazEF toxin-antitoxin module